MYTSETLKYIPLKYKRLEKLKSLLTKCGNKERGLTITRKLISNLKTSLKRLPKKHKLLPFIKRNPIHSLGLKNPIGILNNCLFKLTPAFILKRVFVAGKYYYLPVPISFNRGSYFAANALVKAALENTRVSGSMSEFLIREIGATIHNKGAAYKSLIEYITIALDQRPFSRFIRKRRKKIAHSKRTRIGRTLWRSFRLNKRRVRRRNNLRIRIKDRLQNRRLARYNNSQKFRKRLKKNRAKGDKKVLKRRVIHKQLQNSNKKLKHEKHRIK